VTRGVLPTAGFSVVRMYVPLHHTDCCVFAVCSGSHIENWHSIVRCGLLNASGTQLQVNGAAFGSGVYLSPAAELSFSYSDSRRNLTESTQSVKKEAALNIGRYSVVTFFTYLLRSWKSIRKICGRKMLCCHVVIGFQLV